MEFWKSWKQYLYPLMRADLGLAPSKAALVSVPRLGG